jgi:hypothetical protein
MGVDIVANYLGAINDLGDCLKCSTIVSTGFNNTIYGVNGSGDSIEVVRNTSAVPVLGCA